MCHHELFLQLEQGAAISTRGTRPTERQYECRRCYIVAGLGLLRATECEVASSFVREWANVGQQQQRQL